MTIYNAAVATRPSTAQLEPVTVAERKDWINEHSPDRHPFWVAEIDGDIAGWLTFKSFHSAVAYSGTAELSVYVHGAISGGAASARALLEEAISRAPRLEITALVGLIFAHNESSIALFRATRL